MPNPTDPSSAGVPCDKCNGTGRIAAVIHVHADRPFDAQDPDSKPHYLCGVSLASSSALFARSILVPFVDTRRPLSARSRSTDDYEARLITYVTSLADAGAKLVAVGGSDVGCRSCRQNLGAKLSKAMEMLHETESDEVGGLLDRADGVKHHLIFGSARYVNPLAAIGATTADKPVDPRQVRANLRVAAREGVSPEQVLDARELAEFRARPDLYAEIYPGARPGRVARPAAASKSKPARSRRAAPAARKSKPAKRGKR